MPAGKARAGEKPRSSPLTSCLVPVSRETLEALAREYSLPATAADQIRRLLDGLVAEPDPHTTVSEPERALDVHVRDGLAALAVDAVRPARSLVDIGAGAGFPGLPLAIALPGAQVDLVESASRKCAVVARLAAAASIHNARPVHARVEDWARGQGSAAYDVATARAVAPLAVLAEYAAPMLAPGGVLVAWKGRPSDDEVRAGAQAAAELGLEPLPALPVTPFEAARNLHLYLYSKVRPTPIRFPRKAGIAAKRPLGAKNRVDAPLT